MREIKFRAWDKQNLCWVAPEIVEKWAIFNLESSNGIVHDYMQYTGLKDKNGKEIYEGDIIAFEEYNNQSKKWEIHYKLPVVFYGDRFCATDGKYIQGLNFLPNHIEVIGNIYENPELLGINHKMEGK